jgi:hypothetical protein
VRLHRVELGGDARADLRPGAVAVLAGQVREQHPTVLARGQQRWHQSG